MMKARISIAATVMVLAATAAANLSAQTPRAYVVDCISGEASADPSALFGPSGKRYYLCATVETATTVDREVPRAPVAKSWFTTHCASRRPSHSNTAVASCDAVAPTDSGPRKGWAVAKSEPVKARLKRYCLGLIGAAVAVIYFYGKAQS